MLRGARPYLPVEYADMLKSYLDGEEGKESRLDKDAIRWSIDELDFENIHVISQTRNEGQMNWNYLCSRLLLLRDILMLKEEDIRTESDAIVSSIMRYGINP